jgi:uncharacterized membrane protein
MDNKKMYLISIIAGVILIFLGAFYNMTMDVNIVIPIAFTTAGFVLVIASTIRYNKFGAGVTQDERTRKLSTRAISYSWLLTFIIVNFLFWIDYLKIVELSVGAIIAWVLYPMLLSAAILQMVFKRKGVIDED